MKLNIIVSKGMASVVYDLITETISKNQVWEIRNEDKVLPDRPEVPVPIIRHQTIYWKDYIGLVMNYSLDEEGCNIGDVLTISILYTKSKYSGESIPETAAEESLTLFEKFINKHSVEWKDTETDQMINVETNIVK